MRAPLTDLLHFMLQWRYTKMQEYIHKKIILILALGNGVTLKHCSAIHVIHDFSCRAYNGNIDVSEIEFEAFLIKLESVTSPSNLLQHYKLYVV